MTDKANFTRATATGNLQSLITNYNANLDELEAALDDSLSLSGKLPNSMTATLDMNSQRIINLADAQEDSDAITKRQLDAAVLDNISLSNVNSITFDTTPTDQIAVGKFVWNDQDGTLDLGLKGGNVTLQVGQEQFVRIVNKTGADFSEANYQVVKLDGAQGQRMKAVLAQANSVTNAEGTLGLVTETIAINGEGFVTTSGIIRNINTTGSLQSETWADGDALYLSQATAGKLTNIKPTSGVICKVGYVEHAHSTRGKIFVHVENFAGLQKDTFLQAGASAVSRNLQDKVRESVSVKDFGAVGDGVADDTAAIQAAIDALPEHGTLDGLGKLYVVTTCLLKSNMRMQNFRLKTKASSGNRTAPITIDGNATPKENIFLYNIHVDGNRQNQPTVTVGEDGGMHGFRIVGVVSKFTMSHCSAVYCATDGMLLLSDVAKPATDSYSGLCFQDIQIEHCVFDWNRRHGFAFDSANSIRFVGCDARNNGKDLDVISPLDSGMRGARFAGYLYGRPFDIEGYGVGTAVNDVEIIGGDFTKNSGGALLYDGVDPDAVGFLVRKNIRITNAHFDCVDSSLSGCFTIVAPTATAAKPVYKNIEISNCRFDNWIQVQGVDGLNVNGGSAVADYASNTYYALVANSNNWIFNLRTNKPNILYDSLPFTVTRANVIGSPTYSSETYTLIGFSANGYIVRYEGTLSGSVGAGYYLTFTPSAGFSARVINVSLFVPASAATEQAAAGGATGLIGVGFDLTGTDDRDLQIVFEVVPNS